MPAASALPSNDTELQTRDLTCRELSVRSQSINEEDRSFEAVVTTETPATVFDYRNYEYIDEVLLADGGEFPASVPLLDDHSRYGVNSVMGSASGFRRDGDRWVARGVIGKAVEGNIHREQVWRDVADGHIKAVSIGYQVKSFTDIPAGQKAVIGGRTFEAGERTLRITDSYRVHELSLTPIGADSEALIRSKKGAPPAPQKRGYFAR